MMSFHGTTILAVRHKGKAAVAGDGQVTLNNTIIKHKAKKVRKIYNDRIIVGFAGATADALNLSERLEAKLERYNGNLTRSAVELARDWRTDKYLRRLEAIMIAVDESNMFVISGNGDVGHRVRRSRRPGGGNCPDKTCGYGCCGYCERSNENSEFHMRVYK